MVDAAFRFEVIQITLDKLLPTHLTSKQVKQSLTYRALVASVREVGIVEPLSVFPQNGGRFLILDGHSRLEALRDLGTSEAPCLVASQDEGYTYNKKVNRIAPIQANRMILKALDAGVPEDRIAKALNISVQTIRNHRQFLQAVCAEAVTILQDKPVAQETIAILKKVKPIRQIEMAEMMASSGTYSAGYARAMLMTTKNEQLVKPDVPKGQWQIKPEDLARIEHEVRVQEKDYRLLDESYNQDILNLTIARGYLRLLLDNTRVVKFMAQHHHDLFHEFQRIIDSKSLE